MKRTSSLLCLAAACALAGCNADGTWRTADNTPVNSTENTMNNAHTNLSDSGMNVSPGAITDADRTFMRDVAAAGKYEISAANLILLKTTDAATRTTAEQIIMDHTKADAELKKLADRKSVTLPTVSTPEQLAKLDRLRALSGTEAQQEFMREQVTAHQDAIAKFQTAASSGSDPDVRQFAASTLPALQAHLSMLNGTGMPGMTGTGLGSDK